MLKVNSREQFLLEAYWHLPLKPIVAELGVLQGEFSEMLFKVFSPSKLYLVDPFETGKEKYGAEFENRPTAYSTLSDYEILIRRIDENQMTRNVIVYGQYSYQAVTNFNNGEFDFIYHDASHRYEDIKRDLNEWLPKLKPEGLMTGHDYTDQPGFGVKQAVDEFCNEHNFKMIILNESGGDFALKRK